MLLSPFAITASSPTFVFVCHTHALPHAFSPSAHLVVSLCRIAYLPLFILLCTLVHIVHTTLAILNSCLIIIAFPPRSLDLVTKLLTIEFFFVFIGRGVRQRICNPHELRRDWGYRKQPQINTTASWLPYSAVLRGRLLYYDPRLLGELGG